MDSKKRILWFIFQAVMRFTAYSLLFGTDAYYESYLLLSIISFLCLVSNYRTTTQLDHVSMGDNKSRKATKLVNSYLG